MKSSSWHSLCVWLVVAVSFATVGNGRSRAVMARLGMQYDPDDDFDHPALPDGHPQRRHVLYRIARPSPRPGQKDSPT